MRKEDHRIKILAVEIFLIMVMHLSRYTGIKRNKGQRVIMPAYWKVRMVAEIPENNGSRWNRGED